MMDNCLRRPLLFFCRDPGAANQLAALVRGLRNEFPSKGAAALRDWLDVSEENDPYPPVLIFAKRHAHAVWKRCGIAAEDWEKTLEDDPSAPERVTALLRRLRPDAVVTGVEDVDECDHHILWRSAIALGIPVAAVFDCERNHHTRLRDKNGNLILPDLILTPTQNLASMLAAEGVPANRLKVTGNLHLDSLTRPPRINRAAIRARWGVGPSDFAILFVSENQSEMAHAGRETPYNELKALQRFVIKLASGEIPGGSHTNGRRLHLIIRPHPRDTLGKYDSFTHKSALAITISAAEDPLDAVLAADLVAGMQSMLLDETNVLGCPVIKLI